MTYWTAEKLNKIAARMSGGDGTVAELGSSRWNPMYLTSGQIGTLSFQDCWFQCEIDGAVDFCITATDEFEVKVYRNNLVPYALFFVLMGIMAAAIAAGVCFAKKQCNENIEISSEIKMKPLMLIVGLLLAPALFIIVLMPVVIAI